MAMHKKHYIIIVYTCVRYECKHKRDTMRRRPMENGPQQIRAQQTDE